jgi:hypothetical protein
MKMKVPLLKTRLALAREERMLDRSKHLRRRRESSFKTMRTEMRTYKTESIHSINKKRVITKLATIEVAEGEEAVEVAIRATTMASKELSTDRRVATLRTIPSMITKKEDTNQEDLTEVVVVAIEEEEAIKVKVILTIRRRPISQKMQMKQHKVKMKEMMQMWIKNMWSIKRVNITMAIKAKPSTIMASQENNIIHMIDIQAQVDPMKWRRMALARVTGAVLNKFIRRKEIPIPRKFQEKKKWEMKDHLPERDTKSITMKSIKEKRTKKANMKADKKVDTKIDKKEDMKTDMMASKKEDMKENKKALAIKIREISETEEERMKSLKKKRKLKEKLLKNT